MNKDEIAIGQRVLIRSSWDKFKDQPGTYVGPVPGWPNLAKIIMDNSDLHDFAEDGGCCHFEYDRLVEAAYVINELSL